MTFSGNGTRCDGLHRKIEASVVDPACHFDANPDPDPACLRIRILASI
jgi:hypothetical protein